MIHGHPCIAPVGVRTDVLHKLRVCEGLGLLVNAIGELGR